MMDLILAIIAVTSLTLNILIYQRLRSQNQGVVLAVDEHWAPGILNCVTEPQRPEEPREPETRPSVAAVDPVPSAATAPENKHQAWVNRKGIPLTETIYVPAAPVPIPTPGPLERPGGFAL